MVDIDPWRFTFRRVDMKNPMPIVVAGVLVLAGLMVAMFAMAPAENTDEPTTEETPASIQESAAEPVKEAENDAQEAQDEERFVYFQMTTSLGEIFLELDNERAPISTQNFLMYAEGGHYDGTIFHRVISNFMIQGGAFDPGMKQRPMFDPIENEWTNGLKNVRGSIAMARTSDPDSATAQFFINVVDNDGLDVPRGGAAYAVFGKVVKGMDVVDKIRAVPTGRAGQFRDVPRDDVVIKKVVVLDAAQVEELELVESD
tara:strand:+ start:14174 stop:14947 length:774 start_codon:yes stop_codon:yes gene_type:complete